MDYNQLMKIRAKIGNSIRYINTPLMFLVFILLFLQVLFRYVLKLSVWWIEETVLYLIAYVTLIGAAGGFISAGHPRIRLLINKFTPRAKFILEILFNVLLLIFSIYLMLYGYQQAMFARPFMSAGLRISMFWAYLSLPIGGLLMFIVIAINIVIALQTKTMVTFTEEE